MQTFNKRKLPSNQGYVLHDKRRNPEGKMIYLLKNESKAWKCLSNTILFLPFRSSPKLSFGFSVAATFKDLFIYWLINFFC